MSQFRRLALVAITSGTLAGLAWFALQYFAVIPLIEIAETYEAASHRANSGNAHDHENEAWRPAAGRQRNTYTGLATVLTSIGFAAILFGLMGITGRLIDARRGVLWGLAAFTCSALAPALGLPPPPPGVAVAGLFDRQLWWVATVIATAAGLALIAGRSRSWLLGIGGVACISLPHWIGAPMATGGNIVPMQLVWQFTLASLATTGMFWLILGTLGGFIYNRYQP